MLQNTMKFSIEETSEGKKLFLSEEIDENASFSDLETIKTKVLIVDLNGIRKLNSMGLKKWIMWTRSQAGTQFVFSRCPAAIVNQMNILEGFLPQGSIVDSFYIPYKCDSCGAEHSQLAQRNFDYQEATNDQPLRIALASTRPCENCDETMEWDVIEKLYFRFLSPRRPFSIAK